MDNNILDIVKLFSNNKESKQNESIVIPKEVMEQYPYGEFPLQYTKLGQETIRKQSENRFLNIEQNNQNSEKNTKTANMVRQVRDFDYYLCDTEMEALSLENTLIKQYTPKYNIRLKDAKSYPYIKLTDEEYPRLIMSRKRQNDGGRTKEGV